MYAFEGDQTGHVARVSRPVHFLDKNKNKDESRHRKEGRKEV